MTSPVRHGDHQDAQALAVLDRLRVALDLAADCSADEVVAAAQDAHDSAAAALLAPSAAAGDRHLTKALRAALRVDDSADVDDLVAAVADYRDAAELLPTVQATLDQVLPQALQFGRDAKAFAEESRQRGEEAEQLRVEVAQLRAANASGERDSVLNTAAREGRITSAERRTLAGMWAKDPDGVRALLADRPKNSAVNVEGAGHEDEMGPEYDERAEAAFAAAGLAVAEPGPRRRKGGLL